MPQKSRGVNDMERFLFTLPNYLANGAKQGIRDLQGREKVVDIWIEME